MEWRLFRFTSALKAPFIPLTAVKQPRTTLQSLRSYEAPLTTFSSEVDASLVPPSVGSSNPLFTLLSRLRDLPKRKSDFNWRGAARPSSASDADRADTLRAVLALLRQSQPAPTVLAVTIDAAVPHISSMAFSVEPSLRALYLDFFSTCESLVASTQWSSAADLGMCSAALGKAKRADPAALAQLFHPETAPHAIATASARDLPPIAAALGATAYPSSSSIAALCGRAVSLLPSLRVADVVQILWGVSTWLLAAAPPRPLPADVARLAVEGVAAASDGGALEVADTEWLQGRPRGGRQLRTMLGRSVVYFDAAGVVVPCLPSRVAAECAETAYHAPAGEAKVAVMESLVRLCGRSAVTVTSDAAQVVQARWRGQRVAVEVVLESWTFLHPEAYVGGRGQARLAYLQTTGMTVCLVDGASVQALIRNQAVDGAGGSEEPLHAEVDNLVRASIEAALC